MNLFSITADIHAGVMLTSSLYDKCRDSEIADYSICDDYVIVIMRVYYITISLKQISYL